MSRKTQYKIFAKMKRRKEVKPLWLARLGDGNGTVQVPGYPGLCYVRFMASDIPVIVERNPSVPDLEDLPVTIGTNSTGGATVYNTTNITINNIGVGNHADTHGPDGMDRVYIHLTQLLPLLAYVSGALEVTVNGGYFINTAGEVVRVAKTALDMTASIPGSGASWNLIRASDAGVLSIVTGVAVANIADLSIADDAPVVALGYRAIAYVKLYEGQTALSKTFASPDVYPAAFYPLTSMLLALANLSDVTITGTPADNEVLAYDLGTSEWINQTAAEAGLAAAVHTHVEADITDLDHDAVKIQGADVPAPGAGDDQKALLYDHASGDFIYGEAGGGGDLYWFIDGVLATATGVGQTIVAPKDMTISNAIIYVKENGSANTTTVDININGSSIFAGAKPTIAHDDPNNWAEQVPDTTAITEDDLITVDIDAIATGAASLTVCLVTSSSGGGGGGAPTDATYVTEDANAGLSAESVLGTTVITTNVYASIQAAAKAGRLALPSNGFHLFRDTGAAWAGWGPIYPVTIPVDSGFSWVNQVDATLTVEKGGMRFDDPANAGVDWHLYVKSTPAAPYTFTIGMTMLGYGQYCAAGLVVRDSAGNKFIHFTLQWRTAGAGPTLSVCTMTDVTTWSADYAVLAYLAQYAKGLYWLRIYDNNTTRYYQFSADGQNWMNVYSHARATFITPDQIGYGIASYNSNVAVMMNVISSDI